MVQEAITSALKQTIPPQEIIVVDDGSDDDTVAVISRRFPMVGIVRLPGLGAGPARNAGVEAASGNIIMFLDSDDLRRDSFE
jgi:glycosyltransferase involved in cell wall biosynthesis